MEYFIMKKQRKIDKILYGNLKLLPVKTKTPFDETKTYYKIYNDGGHFVATIKHKSSRKSFIKNDKSKLDELFDFLYFQGIKNNLHGNELTSYIKSEIVDTYCLADAVEDLDKYIFEKNKIKLNNFHKRLKRFKRKAHLNKWNYFCTFTYDDKKHNADSFRRKLKKCLSNLHTRRKWRYMGVFELAPETQRLHFHCLMYIPDGQMIEEIQELQDYSTAQHKMQISHSNTFFARQFGRNDFAKINATEMTINYILKYLQKTNERIVYCRGIAECIIKELKDYDIASEFVDYVYKYVLFDDVISWEEDIMHFSYKQACMFDCC